MRIWLMCVLLAALATAADPLNRDSPQSSVLAFLQAWHSKDYQRASRYLDLRKLPANQRSQEGARLAQQLGQVLESDTRFDEAALSQKSGGEHETVASLTAGGKTLEVQLERVTLRPGVSVWQFPADTVDLIPQLARLSSDSPVEKYLPDPLVSWRLMDTALWRWIALLLLVAVLSALGRLVCRIVLVSTAPALQRLSPRMSPAHLNEFAGPLRLLLVTTGFRAAFEWIGPSPQLRQYLEGVAALGFFTGAAWFCMKVVDLAALRARAALQSKHQTFAYSVLPLASRVLKIVIAVLATVTVLSNWGYNTTTIVAGLGVGGVAIALAAQKTIENLFGGVAVITDRPVTVGDFCKFGDRVGTVEDIGLRSTRIRTPDRTLLTVPNGAFSTMTLENFSQKDKTWFHVMLNLRRDTTPDQVRELLRSITGILKKNPKVETGGHPVRFIGLGTNSLDLEVVAYVLAVDDDELLPVQEDLYLRILDAVENAGTALTGGDVSGPSFAHT